MEYMELYEFIKCLEYKRNVHICVVFLNRFGNYKTALPFEDTIHSKPFCDHMKLHPDGLEKCIKCRNIALGKAAEGQKPFGGFCFNGVYEYCHPVVERGKTVAVIFVGNILREGTFMSCELQEKFADNFEKDFADEQCISVCKMIDSHIKTLLREYADIKTDYDPLVENIKNYIHEFVFNDISVASIAAAFNYNEKYIGKLFKARSGMTVREYLTEKRLETARKLLVKTELSVTEIAAVSGFNNVTYFNRVFKGKFGACPTEYRAEKR